MKKLFVGAALLLAGALTWASSFERNSSPREIAEVNATTTAAAANYAIVELDVYLFPGESEFYCSELLSVTAWKSATGGLYGPDGQQSHLAAIQGRLRSDDLLTFAVHRFLFSIFAGLILASLLACERAAPGEDAQKAADELSIDEGLLESTRKVLDAKLDIECGLFGARPGMSREEVASILGPPQKQVEMTDGVLGAVEFYWTEPWQVSIYYTTDEGAVIISGNTDRERIDLWDLRNVIGERHGRGIKRPGLTPKEWLTVYERSDVCDLHLALSVYDNGYVSLTLEPLSRVQQRQEDAERKEREAEHGEEADKEQAIRKAFPNS